VRINEIETFSPDVLFTDLKSLSANYVTRQMMQAYDRADNMRNNVQTVEAFQAYQKLAGKIFRDSVGEIPYERDYPLNARVTGKVEEPQLTIEKVLFEAREGVYVTANLYLPNEREEKCAAVLLQCGHSENGKAYPAYQRAARIIAMSGIIVLVMDPPGQGERLSYIDEENGAPLVAGAVPHHQMFGNQCFLTGESPVKYFLADAIRAVDYLCSREEVDPFRIGATGISGGGTLTSALMVMDNRIQVAAPGCWPTSGREYFFVGMSPDSEQVWPHTVKNGIDHYEVMAAMCPKPLMILAAEEDFVPIEGTERLFEECKRLWELNGCADNVELTIGKGPHGYSAELAMAAARFFQCHFGGGEKTEQMEEVSTLPDEALRCTVTGQVKLDFPDSRSVFEENLSAYKKALDSRSPFDERYRWLYGRVYDGRTVVKEFRIRQFEPMSVTENDTRVAQGELEEKQTGLCAEPLLWYTQSLMPCYGILFKDTGSAGAKTPVTICLWQGGTDSLADNIDVIKGICEAGRSAFVVDLSAMGKCTPNATLRGYDPCEHINGVIDRLAKHLFTLGDSLCAVKAFDLMETVRMLREKLGVRDVAIYARGNYAILARIAQMLDNQLRITVQNEVTVSDIITHEYYDTYDIAHVLMPGLGKYLD